MSDKVSLEKICAPSELDFPIGEVKNICRDMKELQAPNPGSIFYKFCSDLQSQIYKFQSEFYSGSKNVSNELNNCNYL